jgi:sec-independent protein translocase protein TatB|tara:strand:- start:253 stop:480 length:228 start_codon:yes stop_codon:yes gene_type:complete
MPTIGWFEILLIVAVAIVVVGPKDFPVMLKKVGSWIGSAKRYINEIQNEVTNIEDDTNNSFDTDLKKKSKKNEND